MTYYFEIFGPGNSVPIVVGARGSANTQATSPATLSHASAEFFISGGIATGRATAAGGRPFGADPASFNFLKTEEAETGIQLSVGLTVFAVASACPVCDSPSDEVTSSAFVDPYFLVPPGYTLLLSPGIGNPIPNAPPTPAIPETSTWIMLLAGFAGLGLLGCREIRPTRWLARPALCAAVFAPSLADAQVNVPTCKLHPAAQEPETGITIYTDADGYARFHAVRGVKSQVQQLTCADEPGTSRSIQSI
jgi:hypothetical protein